MKRTYFSFVLNILKEALFIKFSILFAALAFSVITIIDLVIKDDSMSSKPILSSESVQYEIRINESKFRNQIFKELSFFYLNNKFSLVDSISKDQKETDLIKKTIVINKLRSAKNRFEFYIQTDKMTSPLVKLKKLKTTFEIDFDRLYNILESSNSNAIEDNIKYGNYLKTTYEFEKKIRVDYVIIFAFVIISTLVLLYFRNRIGTKRKPERLEEAANNLKRDKAFIKEAKEILKDDNLTKYEIEKLKKLVDKLELNLQSHDFDNILDSVLYEDLLKSEKRSAELYSRSTLMLILGLLVAIVGILIFYFTLPDFTNVKTSSEYMALTIRPALILLFIQAISFYLLRQYRSLIGDYKYFYNEFLKKSKLFTAYQLMQNENISAHETKLIDTLLSTNSESKNNPTVENDDSNGRLLEMLKLLIEKFK